MAQSALPHNRIGKTDFNVLNRKGFKMQTSDQFKDDVLRHIMSLPIPSFGKDIGHIHGINDATVREIVATLRLESHPIAGVTKIGYSYARRAGDLDATVAEYWGRIQKMLDVGNRLKDMRDCLNAGMTPEDIRALAGQQLTLL